MVESSKLKDSTFVEEGDISYRFVNLEDTRFACHGAAEPIAVGLHSVPFKRRRRRNAEDGGAVGLAKVQEEYIDGARGGFLVTVLVFEAAGYGIEIDWGFAVLLGGGVSKQKGRGLRRSRTR